MLYSEYMKRRALVYQAQGLSPSGIAHALAQEGLVATRQGIVNFLRLVEETGNLHRRPGSGKPAKMMPQALSIVEAQMQSDGETTATQLQALLLRKGYNISLWTVLWSRSSLGWTFRGSVYCQMIREQNKHKRLEWAQRHTEEAKMGFSNVVYTYWTSVQLETHRQFCCRKHGNKPRHKPRWVNYVLFTTNL